MYSPKTSQEIFIQTRERESCHLAQKTYSMASSCHALFGWLQTSSRHREPFDFLETFNAVKLTHCCRMFSPKFE